MKQWLNMWVTIKANKIHEIDIEQLKINFKSTCELYRMTLKYNSELQEQVDKMSIVAMNRYKNRHKIITLCGSTKFKDEFIKAQKKLTLEGNIVITVGMFGHSGDEEVWTEGTKEMLDDMHKRKIDLSDAIYVINKGGYVGESTESEIAYALEEDKEIMCLEKPLSCSECTHEAPFKVKSNIHYDTVCEKLSEIEDENCSFCIRKDEREVMRRERCPLNKIDD